MIEHQNALHLQLAFWVANACTKFLSVQAMSALQQQKDAAGAAASHWREQCEAGQAREGLASASRAELEGQLKAKCTESDQLNLAYEQQAQVSS